MFDDANLLILLKADDDKALELIFERYYSLVYSFMLKECQSNDQAKDLTQDVFLKLWLNRHNIAPQSSLRAYLYTISKNTFIDYIRKKVNRKIFEKITDDLFWVDTEKTEDQIELLLQLGTQLPDRQAQVFHYRWVEGLSRKRIASEMQISIVTVDIHLRKIISFFRKMLT